VFVHFVVIVVELLAITVENLFRHGGGYICYTSHLKPLDTHKKACDVINPCHGLGQAHKCDSVKPVSSN
jgi:hypothetical protein